MRRSAEAVVYPMVQADSPSSNVEPSIGSVVLARLAPGLVLLLEARDCAMDLKRSLWDFAVEIADLREAGLNVNDLRWLVCKGMVEHAREITSHGEAARSFCQSGGLVFGKRACFVLTEAGLAMARDAAARAASSAGPSVPPSPPSTDPTAPRILPTWDRERHELRVGPCVVKRFRVPALNQETILAAFEEEGWPVRIDDPLPPQGEQDAKRRLHDTIISLNRNQRYALVRFLGDGSGQGVRWELIEPREDRPAPQGSST